MQQTFRSLIAEMGGQVFDPMPTKEQDYSIATGGQIIHELGGTRMGNDPKTSVVNANCQAHDVKNLFVADGGPFVSQADKNPTWTILALAWRTSDYITAADEAEGVMSDGRRRRPPRRHQGAGAVPFAVLRWDLSAPQLAQARDGLSPRRRGRRRAYVAEVFHGEEWKTVRMLADYIIPRDERSGSATDAKVPEYMDFLMADKEASRAAADRDARRARLARLRVRRAIRHDIRRMHRRAAQADTRRYCVARKSEAGA